MIHYGWGVERNYCCGGLVERGGGKGGLGGGETDLRGGNEGMGRRL